MTELVLRWCYQQGKSDTELYIKLLNLRPLLYLGVVKLPNAEAQISLEVLRPPPYLA